MVPNWYAPFALRESWMGALQPVVGLAGLDVEGDSVDRRVWELLNLGTDLAPTFILNPVLPRKKARREGLEQSTYIPEGLFPIAWADKHRSIIPAVIVVFFKDDAAVTVNKALGKLREECIAFGTQLLVMLIKGPGDDEISTERASALCAAADIPPKSLYILVTSHPDRIHASVHRLERGIREACTAYYATRVRRVKGNKEKSTQLALHVRYNLKLGFFFEIRRDYGSAVTHYELASEGLARLGAGLQEVRVVGAIANYRICRIHLLKREWAEAKTKFQKHVDMFRNTGPSLEHVFEVYAFLEQQYQHFGDLAKQYYGPESNNVLDPVSYFIVAAKYAQKRSELAVQRRAQGRDLAPPLEEDLYPGWEPKFLGQRPWGLDQDIGKLPLLAYFESQTPHSDLVIKHLGLASEFCKDVGRLRTRCQLMSMMGDEFLRSGEFARCILLMAHVLREFGKERWGHLLLHSAQAGLSAAMSLPDISAYLNFAVVLLKLDLRQLLGEGQATLLASNLEAVIEKRVPQHEGLNVPAFTQALAGSEEIKSYVGVHGEPFLSAWIRFGEETCSVHRTTRVLFQLQNRHQRPVFIKSIGIQTNIPEYDISLGVERVLGVEESYETQLEITPKDSNKVIQLQVGVVDIGKGSISLLLHYSLVSKAPPTLWNEWGEDGSGGLNVVKVEGSRPLLQCRVERDEPALVGEAHAVTFIWTNSDTFPLSRLILTFFLSTTNPQLVRLSPDPGALLGEESDKTGSTPETTPTTGGGGLSHSVEVDKLGPGASTQTTLYLRVTGETELRLISKAKYVDSVGQGVSTDFFTPIVIVSPFGLNSSLRDSQGEVLPALTLLQPFVLLHQLTNVAGCPLKLVSLQFKESPPYITQHGESGAEALILQPSETFSALQLLQLCKFPSTSDQSHISCLAVQWSREGKKGEGDGGVGVVSSELFVPIPRVNLDVEEAGLYLTGEFGEGRLKRPMSANYVLLNRSAHCWDLSISIDSTEYFMNAGPKKMSVKLNGGDHVNLCYILFPLKTGLVIAPRLVVEGIDTAQSLVIHRDHPKTVFVRRVEETEVTTT